MDKTVSLKVNGQEIRLNAFVQRALAGTISGLVSSLDGLPAEIHDIQLTLRCHEEEAKR